MFIQLTHPCMPLCTIPPKSERVNRAVKTMRTQQNPAWRNGRPQQEGGLSHVCSQVAARLARLANGMCTAWSPMGVGAAVKPAAGVLRTILWRRTCVRVHFARAEVLRGPPPPLGGGGRLGPGGIPAGPLIHPFPGARPMGVPGKRSADRYSAYSDYHSSS